MRILLLAVALAIISIAANGAEYNLANSVVTMNNFSLDAPEASEISGSIGTLEGDSANITGIDGSIAVYNVPEGFNATKMALELLNYEEPYVIAGWPSFWSWTNISTQASLVQAFILEGDDQLLQVKIESDPATIGAILADLKVQPASEVAETDETTPAEEPANETTNETISTEAPYNITESNATESNVTESSEAQSNATIEKKTISSNPTAAVTIGKSLWDKPESDFSSEDAAKRAENTHDAIRAVKESMYNKGMGKVCTGGDC
jgi:hypothetical protein